MTFSFLIPKHVLRPRLVCAGPSSSAEMHYTKSLTKADLIKSLKIKSVSDDHLVPLPCTDKVFLPSVQLHEYLANLEGR